jgi:putative NIF3 family GTP cyclohydrolase 1 type 2
VLRCARAGVAVYSPHTACDNAAIGVNDWLAEAYAAHPSQVAPIAPTKLPDFPGAGSGRVITLAQPLSLQEAVDKAKKHLGLAHVRLSVAEAHLPVRMCVSYI